MRYSYYWIVDIQIQLDTRLTIPLTMQSLLRVLMNKITCLIILNTTFVLAGSLAPTSSCMATASLDEEYTQTNPVKTESRPINKSPKNFNNPNLYESVQNLRFDDLKQEPEILNFFVPPLVSGNVIPHIPESPPKPSPEEHIDLSRATTRRPASAWRIIARSLFSKKAKKNDFYSRMSASSSLVYKSMIDHGLALNWLVKDKSDNSRQIHFLIPGEEKLKSAVVVIRDDPGGKFCHVRARIIPYPSSSSTSQMTMLLSKVNSSLQMKDVL